MAPAAVSVESLSKVYRVYDSPWSRLGELVTRRPRHRPFVALDDISFTLPKGEALGIIGQNGAGKSTLLKILVGITAPTSGGVEVNGTVASILELGSGFHPEMSGRQNIVINAAMLGLSEEQVRAKTPEIIEFSELGSFIDQPVKCYSSGMTMRLGFAIAMQVDPEILIIDEALSVGDGYFQKKCMDRLLEFVAEGKTLLFCSHAMYYVSAFCQQTLWLKEGHAEALGPTREVVDRYETFLGARETPAGERVGVESIEIHSAGGPARIRDVRIFEGERELVPGTAVLRPGAELAVEVEWESSDPALAFHLGVGLNRADGVEVGAFGTQADGLPPLSGATSYRARLAIPELPLVKGEFSLYLFLLGEQGLHVYDRRVLLGAFRVAQSRYAFGIVRLDHQWDWKTGAERSGRKRRSAAGGAIEVAGPASRASRPVAWSGKGADDEH